METPSRILEASVSLFGMIGELDKTKTLFTLISLIAVLLIFDTFLEMVEYFAEDAGYNGLLQKMYKEMMIMGCISFFVFIVFNSPLEVEHDENYLAFEFAHILLFFLAFFFVLRACSAVHYTRKSKIYFQEAHNTTAVELCQNFIDTEKHPYTFKAFTLNYFGLLSSIQRSFEYRVLEDYFYKEFPLIPQEFRFVDYLSKSFKFYTIDMVEIEPKSWFFLVFLVLVNFVRLTFMGSLHSHDLCSDYHHSDKAGDDHRRQLVGAEDEKEKLIHTCPDYVMWYAIVVGYALLLATLSVCVITHLQKLRLLKLAGISSAEDYVTKLKEFQDQEKDLQCGPDNFEQMSVELKTRIKSRQSLWQKMGSLSFGETLSTTDLDANLGAEEEDFVNSSKRRSRRDLMKQESSIILDRVEAKEGLRLKMHSFFDVDNQYYVSTLVVALGAVSRKHMRHHHEFAHRVLYWFKSICSCFLWNCLTFRRASNKPKINEKLLESARSLRRRLKKEEISALEKQESESGSVASRSDCDNTEIFEDEDMLKHPLLKEIDSIFFFGSRDIYKYLIQLILMLDSFYLSLYATNFISVTLESERPILFNVLIVTTILAMSILVSYLLIVSSILFCVTSLNNKGAEWMCEQEAIKRKVLPVLRQEMLMFLDNSTDVKSFFSLISGDGDIKLCDFSDFLFTLGIHPSQKEIRALFRAVDADSSGAIDLDELKALLFDPTKSLGRSLDDTTHSTNSQPTKIKLRNTTSLDSGEALAKQLEAPKETVVKALSETYVDDENGEISMVERV